MAKVKIYTTPTCTYCRQAKEFFKEEGIDYEEVDVSSDRQAAKEMVKKSGQMGVPVIIIKGYDEPIIGFDRETIEEALGL